MADVKVVQLNAVVIEHSYIGHEVQINDQTVAWRTYDGSGNETVAAEVAEALGELLLGKLKENHNTAMDFENPGEWQKEEPHSQDWRY